MNLAGWGCTLPVRVFVEYGLYSVLCATASLEDDTGDNLTGAHGTGALARSTSILMPQMLTQHTAFA